MEYMLSMRDKKNQNVPFIKIIPNGDTARIDIYDRSLLVIETSGWGASWLRDLAKGALRIARYIDPSEADKKRLEDEVEADIKAILEAT